MDDGSLVLPARYFRYYPDDCPLGYAEDMLRLNVDQTAFLIVDVYGVGFDSDGDTGDAPDIYRKAVVRNRDVVVHHIVPAKAAAKSTGLPIIYLANYLSPALGEDSQLRKLLLRVFNVDVLESWREPNDILRYSEIVAPQDGDHIIKKQLYSGFFETHLDSLLRGLKIHNLVVVGFDSRICLGSTVLDAMYRDYQIIVLRDAVGTSEEGETGPEGLGDALAIRFIETNVGYTATTEDWISACQAVKGSMRVPK